MAPITRDGHLDAAAWQAVKSRCTVRRFWGNEDEMTGLLRHLGHGWRFDYRGHEEDDEPFFKLDKHSLVPGAYVSLTEHDGLRWPFKVVAMTPEASD